MNEGAWDKFIEQHNETSVASVERVRVAAEELRRVENSLLEKLGLPEEDAKIAADVFVQSDLRGEESHGARLLLHVLARIEAGGDDPKSNVKVLRDRHAMAVWDAQRGIGQVIAVRAMQEAIKKAQQYGIGIVGVKNANSYTSAKYYSLLAAEAGMIGITYANSGVQLVVAEGGRTPIVGTNPLSIAAPAKSKPHFVLDMAVSTAMEKVFQAHERGDTIPLGWAIDSEGSDTTTPSDVLKSRALLPIAGPKGFGLGLAHEILTCVLLGGQLFGGGATGFIPYTKPMNVSQTFQAINIDWFVPLEEFKSHMDEVLGVVGRSLPRPGVDHVYYPGEHSFAEEQLRKKEGVPFPRKTVDGLNAWCDKTGVQKLPTV
jgi:LDH2 family malate/lactate/ureidoglycolate dehydrogenase